MVEGGNQKKCDVSTFHRVYMKIVNKNSSDLSDCECKKYNKRTKKTKTRCPQDLKKKITVIKERCKNTTHVKLINDYFLKNIFGHIYVKKQIINILEKND